MKIVLLDGYTTNPKGNFVKELETLGECVVYERTKFDEILDHAQDADIILTNKVPITAGHIDKLPNLKYIGVLATGYNIIDLDAAKKKGIIVTNVPAYSTPSVAQMVFAHILNITQQVQHYADEVRDGVWTRSNDFFFIDTPLIELAGLKLGILGMGQIGSSVAKIAQSFGMEVIANTSKLQNELPEGIKKVNLEELFQESDILSLHCPLANDTFEIINEANLKLMKPSAILINTSRGGLVKDSDLAKALNDETIMAAGLDVLSQEPPKADNPLLTARNCYITPHVAWASIAARRRLMLVVMDNIKGFISGNVINNVAV